MKLLFTSIMIVIISLTQRPGDDTVYTIDKSKSKVNWTGYSLFSFGEHFGSISINEGTLTCQNGQLVGGKVTIDMSSIHTLDEGFEDKDGLAEHLKSPDFFEVDKYPTSVLEITAIKPINDAKANQPNVNVVGMLTMKGIRQAIEFPANVSVGQKEITAKAKFKIDRTKWNVRYNSGKYFSDLGDNAISDAIAISFEIIAAPIH
jgi:polyisoprenoid-binding protein YceI